MNCFAVQCFSFCRKPLEADVPHSSILLLLLSFLLSSVLFMFFSPPGQPKLRFIKHSNLGNHVDVVSMNHVDVATWCSSILHQFLRWIIWLIGFPRAIFSWNGLMYFKTSASLKVVIENSDGVKVSPWSRHRSCFLSLRFSLLWENCGRSFSILVRLYIRDTLKAWGSFSYAVLQSGSFCFWAFWCRLQSGFLCRFVLLFWPKSPRTRKTTCSIQLSLVVRMWWTNHQTRS